MATPRRRANSRKRASEFNAISRAARMLSIKKKGAQIIPDKILRQLAALKLPPNPWVYDVCLRELMRPGGK